MVNVSLIIFFVMVAIAIMMITVATPTSNMLNLNTSDPVKKILPLFLKVVPPRVKWNVLPVNVTVMTDVSRVAVWIKYVSVTTVIPFITVPIIKGMSMDKTRIYLTVDFSCMSVAQKIQNVKPEIVPKLKAEIPKIYIVWKRRWPSAIP